MGLNLSRGEAIKYYSSDRITQIVGNGLVCLIDEKTQYRDFFNDKEMVFYKNINDLSEKIIKISNDEKLRKLIGKNGKLKIRTSDFCGPSSYTLQMKNIQPSSENNNTPNIRNYYTDILPHVIF